MNQGTSASLRYPLSVFNKNSTLKGASLLPSLQKYIQIYICTCIYMYPCMGVRNITVQICGSPSVRLYICLCGACKVASVCSQRINSWSGHSEQVFASTLWYSCGQITLDPSDFGSSRKQPKPIWKSLETVNIPQKQLIIPTNNWVFILFNVKLNFLPASKITGVQSYLSTAVWMSNALLKIICLFCRI